MKLKLVLHSAITSLIAVFLFTASFQIARADYQSTILEDAPSGYWRLGEMPATLPDIMVTNLGSLGSAADGFYSGYVGRQEPGALVGSDNKANRFWGNIAELSRITFDSQSSFNFTGNGSAMPFTLELWAKPAVLSGVQRVIANSVAGQAGYALGIVNNNQLRFTGFGVADVTSDAYTALFQTNQWYHFAVARSNATVYFYVNGTQLGVHKTLNNINSTTNRLTLGRTSGGSESFTGALDEPAVYNSVLTPTQISAHYDAGINNAANYESIVLADNPIGYWRLNEPVKVESTSVIANSGSTGVAADGGVLGSPGSITGGTIAPLVGDPNTAMTFAGPDGRINVPLNPGLNTPSFTVECWAKMDSWANAHISPVTSRYSGGGVAQGFILYAAPVSGVPRWEFWTGNGTGWNTANAGATDVKTNVWTHLVGTYDSESRVMALYVDGKLARGLANVSVAPNQLTPLRIGAGSSELNYGQYHWRGGVDEVAVYPEALSPHQVQAHYEAAKGVSPELTDAPGMLVQPLGQTNWAPYPVIVSCVVTGSLPMQFQWFHVTPDYSTITPVPNGTNMVLKLNPTTGSQSGFYYITATNGLGGIESAWAFVDIFPLTIPTFNPDVPATVPVFTGGTAGIPAVVVGTPPISYQWQSNSVEVPGATSAVLALPNAQASHATATYRVTASNLVGTASGGPAQVTLQQPPVSTYAAVMTGMGPLAYWRLGEPSGLFGFDYWGGHPATYSSAFQGTMPGALAEHDDGAVTLFGSGSNVRSLESEPFNFTGTQPFSLVTWVKVDTFPTGGGRARIFSNRLQATGTNAGYGLGFYNNNTLRFTGYGVVDVNASVPSFTAGQWYHIAAVRSNTMVYLYIDGELKSSGTVANIRFSNQPLQLGGNPSFLAETDQEPLNGTLDDAGVFNRALSSAEISALYAARYGSLLPPTITKQPAPAFTYAGGTARFEVVAAGSQPMIYQWRTNGVTIAGATNSTLILSGVTSAQNNVNVSVVVANLASTATSDNALLTVLQPAGYTAAVLADNPVAFWRLGESMGPVAYDTWGGFNGTDNGAVTYGLPGALANDANTATAFNGSGSKIDVPYDPALNPSVYSVSCWAKVTGGQGTYRCVFSTRDEIVGGFQKGIIIYATSGNVWSFWTSIGGSGAGWQTLNGPAVVLNEWTHLAAIYDGQTKYFYVNGELVNSATIAAIPNDVRPLRIGAGRTESDTGDYFFFGEIDEVALYNTALPGERVLHQYLLGKYSDNTAPFIIRNPSPLSLIAGSTAAFSAQVGGSPALLYQWFHGASPVAGATTRSLSLTNAQYSDAGDYILRVTNAVGYAESLPGSLFIGPPPTFAYLTNDLVLHLKFDGNVQDSSGRSNHGTVMGNPTFVAGRLGQALHYQTQIGVAYDYVSLGTPTDLLFSSNVNFSVSYWARFTGTPGDLPFLCSAVQSYGNFGVTFAPSYTAGGWSWSLGDTTGYVGVYGAANSINNGEWHHLVHTFNRTGAVATAVTYLDGVQVDARSATAVGDIDSGWPFTIGQDPTGSYNESGAADIDDLGIWRKALSAYEAQSIFGAASFANQSFDVAGPAILQIRNAGAMLEIIWQGGVLHESSTLTGIYTPVAGAVPPYHKVAAGPGQKFYKVQPVNP